MAGLDVELLFTDISIDEAIKNTIEDLFSCNIYHGKSSKSELYYLLKLATSFIIDNILYKYIDCTTMGLPLLRTLANTFLCHYEIHLWLPEFLIVNKNLNLLYTENMLTKYLFG